MLFSGGNDIITESFVTFSFDRKVDQLGVVKNVP